MNLSGAGEGWGKNLSDYALSHPNEILISSCSATPTADSQSGFLQSVFDQSIIDLCDLPNVILFIAWGDTKTVDGVDLKVIYNGFYDEIYGDWRYMYSSMANSDKNNYPNSNMRIVVWTNPQWNPDMTNSSWSLFPIGFSNNIMVSGRPVLPIYRKWRYWGEDYPKNWSYNTSYVTPAIASEAQLMFGLHADVKDADMLLLMIESSLTAPDYISLNGQRQALPKYSPANFAKKYCMTTTIPSSIGQGETVTLTKEWYKGLIFAIPGAEVQVNGEWIPFTAENASQIKAANPMHLEWRLNGALLRKYGYSSGQIIQGQIITVDDQWNGLRLEVPVSITIR